MSREALLVCFRQGQQLFRERRYREAESAFRDCLRMHERDLPARNQLAMLLARTGRPEEAEREFLRSLSYDPKNLPALSQLGALYERQGKPGEAEACYRRCLSIRWNDRTSATQLVRLLIAREAFMEAEELILRVIEGGAPRETVHLVCQLGILYAKRGNCKQAEREFHRCLELDADNIHARHQLGMLYVRQERDAEAEALFLQCIALDARQVHAHHQLGMLYTRQERYEEAERMLHTCIRLDNRQAGAYQHLGVLYQKTGRTGEAERMYLKYAALRPGADADGQLAVFYAEAGRAEEAVRKLRALPKGMERRKAMHMSAVALLQQGNTPAAERLLTAILAEDMENPAALHQLGILYARRGERAGAEALFQRILDKDPQNVPALHTLAGLYLEEGRTEEGVALLERIAQADGAHYVSEKLGFITGKDYDPALVWQEIQLHMQDDPTKRTHGVFRLNALEINQAVAQCLASGRHIKSGMVRRYTLNWPNAGYAGGSTGDGRRLDAITVVTYWDGERIISAYPSDQMQAEACAM